MKTQNIFNIIIEEIKKREAQARKYKHSDKYVHAAFMAGLKESIRITKKIEEQAT